MTNIIREQLAASPALQGQGLLVREQATFLGFAPPTSNTTYTPNQFFDVCVPHYSRGCVRLVAYMLRRTLGWCDADGNPQEDQILISYNDLIQHAGISRSMVAKAIEEAITGNFISCVRPGRPDAAGQRAVTALYELRWHDCPEYVKDPAKFQGFFEGQGNRTDIPNQYFDVVVRNESLSVAKVVGSIIRFSIGFQARRGQRRQQVQLSFSDIQRYARIVSRQDLSQALSQALTQNYIVRVQEGLFTAEKSHQVTTTYAIKWSDRPIYMMTSSKSVPEDEGGTGSKSVPGKTTTGSKNVPENRSEIRTRGGSKNAPENRFEKRTTIEMKQKNETHKQQQVAPGDQVAVVNLEIFNLLREQGFSVRDAQYLADTFPHEQVANQLNWLKRRNPSQNPLGLLRRAIEENWSEPPEAKVQTSELTQSLGASFAAHFYAGFAGNQTTPTAMPSANDVEHAEWYVARLMDIWPDKKLAAEWGRRFGELVAELTHGNKGRIVSCVAALRSYGDEFYKQHQKRRKEVVREVVKAAGAVHKKRFVRQYVLFLSAEEQRFKQEHPEAYAGFEESRAHERGYIETSRYYTDDERREQLAIFDSDQRRLKAFKDSFTEILDFWQWDARFNAEPFDGAKVTV